MVRRGSTVRVRQRALQKRRKSPLSRSRRLALPRTYAGYGAVYGAFASPTRLVAREKGLGSTLFGRAGFCRCGCGAGHRTATDTKSGLAVRRFRRNRLTFGSRAMVAERLIRRGPAAVGRLRPWHRKGDSAGIRRRDTDAADPGSSRRSGAPMTSGSAPSENPRGASTTRPVRTKKSRRSTAPSRRPQPRTELTYPSPSSMSSPPACTDTQGVGSSATSGQPASRATRPIRTGSPQSSESTKRGWQRSPSRRPIARSTPRGYR
jgi:hypothetical protein